MTSLMDGYFVGQDGCVFPAEETRALLGLSLDPERFHGGHVGEWFRVLLRRREVLTEAKIPFFQVWLPTRFSILSNFFPLHTDYLLRSPANLLMKELSTAGIRDMLVDTISPLREIDEPLRLTMFDAYGWSSFGISSLVQAVLYPLVERLLSMPAEAMGYLPLPAALRSISIADLLSHLQAARTESVSVVDENVIYNASRTVFSGASLLPGAVCVMRPQSQPLLPGALVVFGSSALHDGPMSPIKSIATLFSETHFICSTDIDYSYVARVNGAVVLAAVTEDVLGNIPKDQYHVGADEYHFHTRFRSR